MYAFDNTGALITLVIGDNYNEWSTELVDVLRAKRKLGFIDGTIPKFPLSDPQFELWSSINSMIIGGYDLQSKQGVVQQSHSYPMLTSYGIILRKDSQWETKSKFIIKKNNYQNANKKVNQ